MAADVWKDKYAIRNDKGELEEETPADMHRRLAREFARIEVSYQDKEKNCSQLYINQLSEFGLELHSKRVHQSLQEIQDELFSYFDKFKYIVPQGSIMANLGNKYVFGSLSNCFGIAPPMDSYAGIMRTDEHIAHLEKRRGGVGTHLNNLRPYKAPVSNAARSSTGVTSFAERFSNTTREVAQEGRRGALMLLLSCKHPDIFKFVTMKDDKTKVTGANVSVMLTDEFMEAVKNNGDFHCRFPIDDDLNRFSDYREKTKEGIIDGYNNIVSCAVGKDGYVTHVMKIHARELFDLIAEMAWKNGEPGVAFIDRITSYAPDGVYEQYEPELCNPCGEQWFHRNDTCRLIATNLFSFVKLPFTEDSYIDFNLMYETFYMQQRLGDDLVDLEVEYIDRILNKLDRDPEPLDIKITEINLWQNIRELAKNGRRTGSGFTALGDMLAALNMKYGSDDALEMVELVMKTKMEAELDASVDLALLRGTFVGWDRTKEFSVDEDNNMFGQNKFYEFIVAKFPDVAQRMANFGRRNVSWSTVAPTGTVSLMTQTTGGLEPLFKAFYIRRKKINANEEGARIDFTDQNGDSWQEYAVLHPKFKEWLEIRYPEPALITRKEDLVTAFAKSPWFMSQAEDVSWEARIRLQAVIQDYTSNAISSTINLPTKVGQNVVKDIYDMAWKNGLKGVTVYREGSRSGVLISEPVAQVDEFGYTDSIKRPSSLKANYWPVMSEGHNYGVVVGLLNDKPYEIFAFPAPIHYENTTGEVTKINGSHYKFNSNRYTIDHLEVSQAPTDIQVLTRFTSGMLRHGMNPRYIIDQVEKANVGVVSFGKAITRVLKQYIPDGTTGEKCPKCGQATIVYQEGCRKCSSCGHSAC